MKSFTIFNKETGKVVSNILCVSEKAMANKCEKGEDYIEGFFSEKEFDIHPKTRAPIPQPERKKRLDREREENKKKMKIETEKRKKEFTHPNESIKMLLEIVKEVSDEKGLNQKTKEKIRHLEKKIGGI